jgi:pyrroloquinoline quinone (PQQ) biosynthesis protein C
MESHVFAVWDFMSLLKSLQAGLTCVRTPWIPNGYPQASRLVNEIVLGEESDTFGTGTISHFELYLKAMAESEAGTYSISTLIEQLRAGRTVEEALVAAQPPEEARAFVETTFALLAQNKLHVTAAAFTFGREDLIPDMFHQMVKDLRRNFHKVDLFEYYLNRHIEVDGDTHGPLALQMVEELCGFDDKKWQEAADAAERALEARIALWDGILRRIRAAR